MDFLCIRKTFKNILDDNRLLKSVLFQQRDTVSRGTLLCCVNDMTITLAVARTYLSNKTFENGMAFLKQLVYSTVSLENMNITIKELIYQGLLTREEFNWDLLLPVILTTENQFIGMAMLIKLDASDPRVLLETEKLKQILSPAISLHLPNTPDYDLVENILIHKDKSCHVCGNDLHRPNRCGKCKVIIYCNRECQMKDWRKHKLKCETFKSLGRYIAATYRVEI